MNAGPVPAGTKLDCAENLIGRSRIISGVIGRVEIIDNDSVRIAVHIVQPDIDDGRGAHVELVMVRVVAVSRNMARDPALVGD